MKYRVWVLILVAPLVVSFASAQPAPGPANPAIDMEGYLRVSLAAAKHRHTRRLSEADFIRMSREPGTVILDARSRQRFDELHVKGALNLSFPDIETSRLEFEGTFLDRR